MVRLTPDNGITTLFPDFDHCTLWLKKRIALLLGNTAEYLKLRSTASETDHQAAQKKHINRRADG